MAKNNLWDMAGLDIFLQSLNEKELKKYAKGIVQQPNLSPLKGVGISAEFFAPRVPLKLKEKDKNALKLMESQFLWKTDFSEILSNPYDALIVTDSAQTIIWTNPGFFEMTGYYGSYAIGKQPSFLQGAATSTETKAAIRDQLLRGRPFTEKILNYKKNEEEYWCEIMIFPLKHKGKITHFLALETELI